VQACNSYQAMREALNGIIDYCQRNDRNNWQWEKFEDQIRRAKHALALTFDDTIEKRGRED